MAMTASTNVYDVVIVGGGIAGMATAIGLIRRGITNVLLLEKAVTMHPVGASLAVFSNGLKALEYISPTVAEKVRRGSIPIERMILKDLDGNVIRQTTPPNNATVNYLVWYLLQRYLAEELPEGVLRLGHAVQSHRVGNDGDDDGVVTITASDRTATAGGGGETMRTIKARILVGADGIHSPIREQLFGTGAASEKHCHGKRMFRFVLPSSSLIAESLPPTGTNVSFQGREEGKVFHYRETASGIITVTSMARFAGDEGDASRQDGSRSSSNGAMASSPEEKKEGMVRAFEGYPAEVQALLRQVPPEAVYVNDIQDIDVLDAWSRGPVMLIGDAAHAMSPALGQGANQGLEDACALVHGLVRLRASWAGGGGAPNPALLGSNVVVPSLLCRVWGGRIDRVRRIHAASRARSVQNNRSSQSKPVDMSSEELKNVLSEIEAWDAPIDGGAWRVAGEKGGSAELTGGSIHTLRHGSVISWANLG